MSVNIFFTSDLHLYHQNILQYTKHNFSIIEQRNEAIVNNWNSVIKNGDTVYILGDYVWRLEKLKFDKLKQITNRLNGNKILVRGNHDRYSNYQYVNSGIKEVYDILNVKIANDFFVLCHYAMKFWQRSHYGSYCLYGHEHFKRPIDFQSYAKLEMSTRTLNVCMDGNNLFPYSVQDIYKQIGDNPINFVER